MRLQTLLFASAVLICSTLAIPPLRGAPRPRPLKKPTQSLVNNKYFREPMGSEELNHYDIRYFSGEVASYEDRVDSLHHLIRSYLLTFREKNIETWIAHGTLLGWWWNGKIMPWDWDIDTQVSAATLKWLSENLNMTTHKYTGSADDGTEFQREYLLDVNPNYIDRVFGDGSNVIDARWIDVRNGLYIDITGLSEIRPSTQPGVWSCKNSHHYRTRDLYPLRETVFEGVPALVPYSFDRILTAEYTNGALTKTYHMGHHWAPEQKKWIPDSTITINRRGAPHVPRSLQPESESSGLRNLLRVL